MQRPSRSCRAADCSYRAFRPIARSRRPPKADAWAESRPRPRPVSVCLVPRSPQCARNPFRRRHYPRVRCRPLLIFPEILETRFGLSGDTAAEVVERLIYARHDGSPSPRNGRGMPLFTTWLKNVACGMSSFRSRGMFSCSVPAERSRRRARPPPKRDHHRLLGLSEK